MAILHRMGFVHNFLLPPLRRTHQLTLTPRLLPIHQPRRTPTNQQIQRPRAPTRHLPPAISHRSTAPLPRLAQHRAHQRQIRRLEPAPLASLLVRRRIRSLAHAVPSLRRTARGRPPSEDLYGSARVRRDAEAGRDFWICHGERAALF